MIRVNPALLADELGLIADYGLSYAEPDPVEQVAFPDGEQLTMWLDRERTIEEVARFSRADAAATAACSTSTTRSNPSSAGGSSPRSASARRWTRCSPSTRAA
jgi:phytoene dehydrogenase-like protein